MTVDPGPCPSCGSPNRPGSRFCARCGAHYPPPRRPAPLGPRYWPLRIQVDPLDQMPRRDIRWVLIVLGIAFIILAILLLVVSSIVSSVVPSSSTGCSAPPCPNVDPGVWFDWIGLPFLALGIVLLGVGLWWAVR